MGSGRMPRGTQSTQMPFQPTFAQPTIDDFLALIDRHIDKARKRAGVAVSQVRAQGAAHGRSSRIVLLLCEAIQTEFEKGVEAVLGELSRIIQITDLHRNELRQCAVERLNQFAVDMKAVMPRSEAALLPGFVQEQFAALDQDLQFSLRQYDVGFFIPSEPEFPQVSNSIINTGTMSNSPEQLGSPGAAQSVTINVDEIRAAIDTLERHSGNLGLPVDKLSELQSDITTIKAQLTKSAPPHSILGDAARSIQNVFEGATKEALTPVITNAITALGKATGAF
jgi:hypothetical protein